MLYLEYEEQKQRYNATYAEFEAILSEKETLFAQTQLQAVDYGKDRVSGSSGVNAFERYIIAKEKARIDERLAEARSLLNDRREILDAKEKELRKSPWVTDRVYLYKKIERRRVFWIAKRMNYSKSQIYRILKKIDDNIKDATK